MSAQEIQKTLSSAHLHIVDAQSQFDERTSSADDSLRLPLAFTSDTKGLVDPATVSLDVSAQLAFFRKLKYQYLEQKAKDQYIKIIVSDDAPSITAADNELQRQQNELKKQDLKEEKQALAEMHSNIRTLAPLVEQDYNRAKALTAEAVTLARNILDARLAVTRLRQAYPHPRLTVPSAEAQLEDQVADMQNLEDTLQTLNGKIDAVKNRVKTGARDVERMRVDRADLEKLVKKSRSDVDDARVVGLYDWYTASLNLHKSFYSLESSRSASENELHLVYSLSSARRKLHITLVFVPNTCQLANAQISGMQSDTNDLVGAHVAANNVPGLIAAVLARARNELV
ncbi:hypothetical protein PHLCEN_2v13371 [Hermanssonia centrifuga]|uniref:Kinetochore protein Sos7 coiled-coil domain-containing protein n=1 Tax=Hermanssonia centrifuga TaxID=98765 RepID=A0A2R6NEJ0_9APHY|nr:hypothetical protein PHLCEN_2v13371 [Hermanssonia centrifuga]